MARGRMIDKRVSNSKKIGKISDKSKVLWFMIYPHLDREGRIAFDDLDDLKVEIIPYFNWTIRKVADALNDLAEIKLIKLYPNDTKFAIQYRKFENFQIGLRKDREAESEVVPYGVNPESSGDFRILSPKFKLKEVKGRKEGIEEKIIFDFDSESWKNISDKDRERWGKTYPACNLDQELLFMADWLISHPEKKKSNYKSFISRWLKRVQDRGGTRDEYKPSQIGESKQKPTDKKEEYYEDRHKKEIELREKYKKKFDSIRKRGDVIAGEALEEYIRNEMVKWTNEYKGGVNV